MAHKKVDPKVLEGIERSIASHMEAVRSAEVYREDADRTSIQMMLKNIRTLLDMTKEKKDNALLLSSDEGANFARFLLGRQKAYEELILSFEDAEGYKKLHLKEIESLESERAHYEQYTVGD